MQGNPVSLFTKQMHINPGENYKAGSLSNEIIWDGAACKDE
jgi:hypothetical protein